MRKQLKLAKQNQFIDSSIGADDWYIYFCSSLFENDILPLEYSDGNYDDVYSIHDISSLNEPFILTNVELAIWKLANGKSCGLDGVPSELY
jgi:hypothetical protein